MASFFDPRFKNLDYLKDHQYKIMDVVKTEYTAIVLSNQDHLNAN